MGTLGILRAAVAEGTIIRYRYSTILGVAVIHRCYVKAKEESITYNIHI